MSVCLDAWAICVAYEGVDELQFGAAKGCGQVMSSKRYLTLDERADLRAGAENKAAAPGIALDALLVLVRRSSLGMSWRLSILDFVVGVAERNHAQPVGFVGACLRTAA